jgi:integrase
MRKPQIVARPYRHDPQFKFVVDLRGFGKGRRFFKTRSEAEAEAFRQRTLLEKHSRELIGLSRREMSRIIEAKQRLAEYGKTIEDAAEFFLDHLDKVLRHGITVSTLTDELIRAKRSDGMSKDYLDDLRLRLKVFCRDFGSKPIAGITVEELDHWLRGLPVSPKSRANYRANVSVLFGHAMRRRIIDSNPVLLTARPKLIDRAPEIFEVDELQALLDAATRVAPDLVPMLAIGAFAGLREAEIRRLDWSEVDLDRAHIEVKAAKAKSARRRIIPIQPNLMAWLEPYAGRSGKVAPSSPRRPLVQAKKAAGLARWPNNGLRHSFASYRLAAIHDAPRVSAELGHTSPQMLYGTYRELVLPAEAERYWKITPALVTHRGH